MPDAYWQYYGFISWSPDPAVRITKGQLSPCQTITVGETAAESIGEYFWTGEWSRGRQVFKKADLDRYIFVPKMSCWVIQNGLCSPSFWTGAIKSASSSWCPVDPRARWKNGGMTVKCDVHTYMEELDPSENDLE